MSTIYGLLNHLNDTPLDVVSDMGDLEYLARIANGELSSGILVNLFSSASGTILMGTVPPGKDWYLMGWSVTFNSIPNGIIKLEYPTSTIIETTTNNDSSDIVYVGISKGHKLTAGQTITVSASSNINKGQNIFILEVDIGQSPKLT